MKTYQGEAFMDKLSHNLQANLNVHALARITRVHAPYVDAQVEWKSNANGLKESEMKDLKVIMNPIQYIDHYHSGSTREGASEIIDKRLGKIDLKVGDEIILEIMDREISSHSSGDYRLQDDRMHDATDAIVIGRIASADDFARR